MEHITGDEAAVRIMLGRGSRRQKEAKLAAVMANLEGCVPCPDCGHEGPHDEQVYMGVREFSCAGCGMQFEAPEVTL